MSSRDAILAAVRAARLSGGGRPDHALPDIGGSLGLIVSSPTGLVERFTVAARATAVDVVDVGGRERVGAFVRERFGRAGKIVSMIPDVSGASDGVGRGPLAYADTELFVCEGALGVAENGAVWLPASRLGERAALFLATDVLIVLSRGLIVGDVHEAYARVRADAGFGQAFGIFVAGPSKTADIEQALVIGAHGPKGMTVLLVD